MTESLLSDDIQTSVVQLGSKKYVCMIHVEKKLVEE